MKAAANAAAFIVAKCDVYHLKFSDKHRILRRISLFLLHKLDESERAFQGEFAVHLELEGDFGVHLLVPRRGVGHFAVVEFRRVGVEGEIYAQRSAYDGDLRHDVAAPAVGVALAAYAALDLRRAFRCGGERRLHHGVTLLDDVVRERVFFRETQAFTRRLSALHVLDVHRLSERGDGRRLFSGDVGGCESFLLFRIAFALRHADVCVRAGEFLRFVAVGAITVASAQIALLAFGFQPFVHVKSALQFLGVISFFHNKPFLRFSAFCSIGFTKYYSKRNSRVKRMRVKYIENFADLRRACA